MPDSSNTGISLTTDNQDLRQRVAELEQRLATLTQELDRSRSLCHAMLDNAPVALATLDMQGRYVMMNRSMHQMLGLSEEQDIQQHYSSIVPLPLLPMIDPAFRQVETRDVMQIDEYPVNLPSGISYFQTIMYPIHDQQDRPIAVGMISLDITERKQMDYERKLARFSLNRTVDAIYQTDAQGRFVYVNDAACQSLGYTRSELLQLSIADVEARLSPDAVQSIIEMLREQGSSTFESSHRRKDGTLFPVEVTVSYIEFDGMVYTTSFARDITERKQMESDLKLAKFSLDRAVDTVLWGRMDGQLIYANEAASRDLGYSHDELLTMSIPQIDLHTPPERLQEVMASLKQRGAMRFETRHCRKDGTTFPVEVTTNYLTFDGQEYLFAFVQDITARKRYEDELRTFKMLVENSPDGIGLTDAAGNITYSNLAHRRMFGYGDEIIGIHMRKTLAPEAYAIMEQAMQVIMAEGSWIGESLNLRKDGTLFPVEASIFALYDNQGEMQGMAGIIRDCSERKQAEHERLALQERIIEAQRDALREISTPILPIAKDVLIMPLIGTIDSQRAQMVMETLMEGVAHYQADIAILDITGVAIVDTQVANALIRAAHAVRLLGAQVMLTGIQPQIAQTLVHLGVDLTGILTRGSLQHGIADALLRRV